MSMEKDSTKMFGDWVTKDDYGRFLLDSRLKDQHIK